MATPEPVPPPPADPGPAAYVVVLTEDGWERLTSTRPARYADAWEEALDWQAQGYQARVGGPV